MVSSNKKRRVNKFKSFLISFKCINEIRKMKNSNGIQKYREFYTQKPDAPLVMKEFGWFTQERWINEGHIMENEDLFKIFDLDELGNHYIAELGWCEASFSPLFSEKLIEDRGEHEVIQDSAGRHVLYFKNKRSGFMPEYLDHPVKDEKTWIENVKWRLNPFSAERFTNIEELKRTAIDEASKGKLITEQLIGGYMYLRSLFGPENLLYTFYDNPKLIHECMETWFNLSNNVLKVHQKAFTIDEIFLAEDICYNVSSLISHDMVREFLFPYYIQLIQNVKLRQIDKNRKLYVQIDTDGKSETVIDLYKEIGMNFMSPFEVASGGDVVKIREKYPDLLISGGFDKRILSRSKAEIDKEINRIMPIMKKKGGYIPTCDHGVPEEVSFENYLHFRKRIREFA